MSAKKLICTFVFFFNIIFQSHHDQMLKLFIFIRVESIETLDDEGKCLNFNCKHLIIDSTYAPPEYYKTADDQVSRCILITDKSIYLNEEASTSNENVGKHIYSTWNWKWRIHLFFRYQFCFCPKLATNVRTFIALKLLPHPSAVQMNIVSILIKWLLH